jgi:hypothetical protein
VASPIRLTNMAESSMWPPEEEIRGLVADWIRSEKHCQYYRLFSHSEMLPPANAAKEGGAYFRPGANHHASTMQFRPCADA